jgi:hypothetical protein
MAVTVGQVVVGQGYCKAVGATGTGGIRIDWLNASGTLLSSTTSPTTVTGTSSWTLCKVVGTAPASTASARFAFYTTTCTAGYFQFDNSMMQLQSSSVDEVPDGATYARTLGSGLSGGGVNFASGVHVNKTLDNINDGSTYVRPKYVNTDGTFHVSTALNSQGSITTTQNLTSLPTYTATTSSITFNITAQSLTRADGSAFNILAGSQTFSGLSASTAYYLYPYITTATGIMSFANTSTLSTSASSLYMLQTNGDGHMSLPVNSAGTQVLSTTSFGSQGGGGGAGSCPEGQELVEEQTKGVIKAIDVKVGDLLKGKVFSTGQDIYRKVIQTSTQEAAIWRMVDGHKVSPCEPLWHEGMWKPAYQAVGSTIAYGNGTRVNLSLETDDYNEQNYYLVDGTPLLIHNEILSQS